MAVTEPIWSGKTRVLLELVAQARGMLCAPVITSQAVRARQRVLVVVGTVDAVHAVLAHVTHRVVIDGLSPRAVLALHDTDAPVR